MGRSRIEVDIELVKQAIEKAEANGPLGNLSQLYHVAQSILVNELGANRNITPSVVMLRIQEENIPVKTQKGRRGFEKGWKSNKPTIPNSSAAPQRKREIAPENVVALRLHFGSKYGNLVDKVERGSLTAMIRLNCLDCAGEQREEIRYCENKHCPFWSVRPYRNSLTENIEEIEDAIQG